VWSPVSREKHNISSEKRVNPFSCRATRLSLVLVCMLAWGEACSTSSNRSAKERKSMNDEQKIARIEKVLETNRERLMSIPGVVGVGIGGSVNSPSIVVMFRESTPELKRKLPRRLGGFPVQGEVTGEINAF